jgi:Fur family transcriptional regulator, iron response regulator
LRRGARCPRRGVNKCGRGHHRIRTPLDADPPCTATGRRPSHPSSRPRGSCRHRQRVDLAHAIFGSGARHFTAETLYQETRAIHLAPTRGTIYNTLNEFARCGLLREIALYAAKVWYDTKTGPHFHFYFEDTDELSDIPDCEVPEIEIPPPEGMRVAAIDVIVRVKKA